MAVASQHAVKTSVCSQLPWCKKQYCLPARVWCEGRAVGAITREHIGGLADKVGVITREHSTTDKVLAECRV